MAKIKPGETDSLEETENLIMTVKGLLRILEEEKEKRVDMSIGAYASITFSEFREILSHANKSLRQKRDRLKREQIHKQNPNCPYPGLHNPSCDCRGMGGGR